MRSRLLLATVWAGSLWTIGYLVAPTLFATLSDRVLTGNIAASLFRVQAWLSIFCAIVLFALLWRGEKNMQLAARDVTILFRLVGAMLACTLVSHLGLQPFMAHLREVAGASGVMASDQKMQFGILHGLSSVIYLIESVLAVFLVLRMR